MDPAHRALLRVHRLELSGQLLVSDSIVPVLYQEEVLTEAQVELVEAQPTNRQRALKLLDLLPTRGPRAFPAFLRALDDYSWIRDRLLQELQTGPGPGADPVLQDPVLQDPVPQDPVLQDPILPDSVLMSVPSDRVLSRLSLQLGAEAEAVLMDLGLSAETWFRCRSDQRLSSHGAVLSGLVQWRRREGRRATVQRLQQSLRAAGVQPQVLESVLRDL